MSEKWPPMTWPEGASPTVDQLKTWLRAHDPEQHDARVAADMIVGMLADQRRAHGALIHSHAAVESQARRYRLAWLSARSRVPAGRFRAVLDAQAAVRTALDRFVSLEAIAYDEYPEV